jgi:hypothetical protein
MARFHQTAVLLWANTYAFGVQLEDNRAGVFCPHSNGGTPAGRSAAAPAANVALRVLAGREAEPGDPRFYSDLAARRHAA